MRKRTRAAFTRPPRKRLVSSAEVAAALDDMIGRMPESTPEQIAAAEKYHARFDRWQDKGRAKWDALTPAEQKSEADRMLAEIRRRDSEADDRDLGPDGGRDMYAIIYACDRQRERWAREDAKRPKVDLYAAHRATIARDAAAAEAVRQSPAPEKATAADAPPEPPTKRTRRRAGLVAVIDPRLYDTDEEDWL